MERQKKKRKRNMWNKRKLQPTWEEEEEDNWRKQAGKIGGSLKRTLTGSLLWGWHFTIPLTAYHIAS